MEQQMRYLTRWLLCPVMLTAITSNWEWIISPVKKQPWALLLQDLLTMKISLTITLPI